MIEHSYIASVQRNIKEFNYILDYFYARLTLDNCFSEAHKLEKVLKQKKKKLEEILAKQDDVEGACIFLETWELF